MKRDESVYLRHIMDAIVRIEEYLREVDEHAFKQRNLIQDWVIRQLEIIGESVKNLSPDFRDTYAHIPWQDIAGTRDKLIHGYFGVDIDKVWLMATDDIPSLKTEVTKILNEF
jgi:uncharacterized protein with HEPN domain